MQFEAPFHKAQGTGFYLTYELMPYRLLDGGPVYYDRGVKPLMLALAAKHNVSPLLSNHILIGIDVPVGRIRYGAGSQIRIEMGPFHALSELEAALHAWIDEVVPAARALGLGFTSLAYHPDRDPQSVQIVSKQRYPVMQRRFKTSGTRGLHMMTNTAGVSLQLQCASEKEWADTFRTAVMLAPYLLAMFGNGPIERGKLQPVQSMRMLSWMDVDRARTAFFTQALEPGFGYQRYIEWALSVPVLGVDRQGLAVDVGDVSFRDAMSGKLYIGEDDWVGHLDTLWPGVRFSNGVDVRLCDTGRPEQVIAFASLVLGLLRDAPLRAKLQKQFAPQSDFARLPQKAARQGLSASSERGPLLDGCLALVRLVKEKRYLAPLREALAQRASPADEIRERYGRDWTSIHDLFKGTSIVDFSAM